MPSQGPNSGGTAIGNDHGYGTSVDWTNPSNALVSDSSYATCSPPSNYGSGLLVSNFGFSISGTINGILVEVQCKNGDYDGAYLGRVFLMNGATGIDGYGGRLMDCNLVEAYRSIGNSTDTWLGTLTDTIINSSAFGIRICGVINTLLSVNHVRVTVYYSPAPTIVETGSLSNFGLIAVGQIAANQTFTVSGTNLTANLVVTAPTDFEVSLSSGSGFGSSVSIAPSSGTVATTTIYCRFKPGSVGAKSGNVAVTSTGATTQNVAAAGSSIVSNYQKFF